MKDAKDKHMDFLMWFIRATDGYWFLRAEKRFGLSEAVGLNEEVWERMGAKSAKRIKELPGVGSGLSGFVSALKYYPWSSISGYEIEEEGDRVVITVPRCPPQVWRTEKDIGEYPCKEMHMREFSAFAREIDPRIIVKCVYAPPDSHPKECFCRWEFSIRPEE